jgi:hypothetical protein
MKERLKRLEQLLTDPFKPDEVLKELEKLLKGNSSDEEGGALGIGGGNDKDKGNFGKKLSHCLRLAGRTSQKD